MCTAIKVDFKDGFFGRNMDIDHSFGEQIIITPRNYRLKFKVSNSFERHYAIMGVGTVIDEYPLYADAMNEKGLCFAGLSFKDNAKYYPIDLKKENLNEKHPLDVVMVYFRTFLNRFDIISVWTIEKLLQKI